jgi:carbamoyl-phosphate synthase small subunit
LERTDKPAFCFQGHPEASPGPHDVSRLFDRFIEMMEQKSSSRSSGARQKEEKISL